MKPEHRATIHTSKVAGLKARIQMEATWHIPEYVRICSHTAILCSHLGPCSLAPEDGTFPGQPAACELESFHGPGGGRGAGSRSLVFRTGAQVTWTLWNPLEPGMKTDLPRSPGSQDLPKLSHSNRGEREVQLSVCRTFAWVTWVCDFSQGAAPSVVSQARDQEFRPLPCHYRAYSSPLIPVYLIGC